jgi:DNA-binding LytR/AlgR family response regulator
MHPPRCLIAEDEPLLAASLQAELAAVWPELEVCAVLGDGHQAVQQALAQQPQICFFDITMPGCTGLEAAQALAEDWPGGGDAGGGQSAPMPLPLPLLVFVTAHQDRALQAFDVHAVDYLVKPVQRPRLLACVQRLQSLLAQRQHATPQNANAQMDHTLQQLRALLSGSGQGAGMAAAPKLRVIQAQVGNLVQMVPVEDVLYFEAADKYVRVVTEHREHLIRLSLRELLPQLEAQQFWQVHRGTVVQIGRVAQAVREDTGRVVLSLRGHADKLVVSRLYAHLFKGQ